MNRSLLLVTLTAVLTACGTPPPTDFGGNWIPVNRFQDTPQAIPLAPAYAYYASPMDGTLRGMLRRWADDNGLPLIWQLDSDYTLHKAVTSVRSVDLATAVRQLNAIYAGKGVFIMVNAERIVVATSAAAAAAAAASGATTSAAATAPRPVSASSASAGDDTAHKTDDAPRAAVPAAISDKNTSDPSGSVWPLQNQKATNSAAASNAMPRKAAHKNHHAPDATPRPTATGKSSPSATSARNTTTTGGAAIITPASAASTAIPATPTAPSTR